MINSFIIVAQEAKTEKAPTRRLTTNIGDENNAKWVDLGAGWVRQNAKGETFLSVLLNQEERTYKNKEERTYKNKEGFEVTVPAYVIIDKKEYEHLKNCEERCKFLTSPSEDHPNGIDMAKHPLNSPAEQADNDKVLNEIPW